MVCNLHSYSDSNLELQFTGVNKQGFPKPILILDISQISAKKQILEYIRFNLKSAI